MRAPLSEDLRPDDQRSDPELSAYVLEQAPDAIIVTDLSGRILMWNARATAIFGFSAAEATKGGLDLIIPGDLRAAHWQGFRRAMDAGKVKLEGRAVLTRAMHKSGDKRYVELSFAVLSDASGDAIGAIAIARDMTERQKNKPRRSDTPAASPSS